MTGDNKYNTRIFSERLVTQENFQERDIWKTYAKFQFDLLMKAGLTTSSNIADIGCGPLRLGHAVIDYLDDGHYYGVDINRETLRLGREVLRKLNIKRDNYTLIATDAFDFSKIQRPLDMAFSNSLFSHLTMNSIRLCLLNLKHKLKPGASYYSSFFCIDEGSRIEEPRLWNSRREFTTHINRDPYHYRRSDLQWLAEACGYSMDLEPDYGHPTQSLARFTLR